MKNLSQKRLNSNKYSLLVTVENALLSNRDLYSPMMRYESKLDLQFEQLVQSWHRFKSAHLWIVSHFQVCHVGYSHEHGYETFPDVYTVSLGAKIYFLSLLCYNYRTSEPSFLFGSLSYENLPIVDKVLCIRTTGCAR